MLNGKLVDRIEFIAIEDILNTWGSCDSNIININPYYSPKVLDPKEWKTLLAVKREDKYYYKCLENIRKDDFLMPLNYYVKEGITVHGNGHHRLAAAIELGYLYVPYIEVKDIRHLCRYWRKTHFEKYDFKANNPQYML